ARGLGYVVLGIAEYYTSRRCPTCKRSGGEAKDFVGYIGSAAHIASIATRGITGISWRRPT
ncbi:hypothetical protein BGX28_009863, partial [Mortierella sp. GBA30]